MATKINIPTPLRPFTGKQDVVEVDGATVGELLGHLTSKHEGLKKHLYNDEGKLRSFVNIYLNDEDIRYLDREGTAVKPGDTLSIIPSVAGGVGTAEAPPVTLNADEIKRYSRHLILPEVGMEGQKKLKAARVLCIGAGGLGSPLALYLAAAGVGTHRHRRFRRRRLQQPAAPDPPRHKGCRAPEARFGVRPPAGAQPEREGRAVRDALTTENALQLFKDYDVIVDGTDNFPTRYLVNDACVILGKPNVYGTIFRFEGQASVFGTKEGPCYRCLYPEPPPPGLVPSCAEGGVLGVLPGIVGCIQANETLKLILGIGEPLVGRFLVFDALRMKFRELKLRKDPDCPVCGTHPTVTALIDYEQFCGVSPAQQTAAEPVGGSATEISVTELKARMDRGEDVFVLDVREPHEYEINRIPGSTLIPLGDLAERVAELDANREIITQCKSGMRSARAASFLREHGFKNVKNLKGGVLAWVDQIDPSSAEILR